MYRFNDFFRNAFYCVLFLLIVPYLIAFVRKNYHSFVTQSSKIGVISFNQSLMNSGDYVKNLKKFFKNSAIKGILFRMNCPGGAAGTSQALYNELVSLKRLYPTKPVVVLIENLCASGGYYVASPCNWIVATGSSFIGSIGVYIATPRLKAFINQFNVEYAVTKTGKYKTALNPLIAPIPGEEDLLQELCDDTYDQFIHDVVAARPVLSISDADLWANGKIFTGRQALQMKLIDQLGSFSQAEEKLKELAHIPAHEEIQWVHAEQKNNLMKIIFPDETGESTDDVSLNTIIGSCLRDIIYGDQHVIIAA